MRPILRSLLMLILTPLAPLMAQATWHLTLERGMTTFSAEAHDSSTTDRVHLRPWHPTLYALRLTRESGRIGLGLGLGYASAPIAGNIDDFVLLFGDRERLFEIAPEVRYRVGTTSSGAALRFHLGPVIDLWTPDGADTRTVLGAVGGATLTMPLGARWSVDVRTDVGITGATVTAEEASPEVIRASTVRRGRLALGITRRL